MRSLRWVRAGWRSDSPNSAVRVVHYSIPPSKHDAERTSLTLSVSNTQSADVAIFISHCDYMLVTISMTTSISADILMRHECAGLFFLPFFSVGNPALAAHTGTHFGDVTPRGNSVLAKSPWDLWQHIQDQLSFLCFHLPLQLHPDPQTNSDTLWMRMSLG